MCNKINKLIEILRSPYPFLCQRWKTVVIPSVIVFLILYILQPFGISQIGGSKFWVTFGSALVSVVASCIVTYLLPALFPSYYKEQNWTLGKYLINMLLLLLLITVGIWAFQSWLMGIGLNARLFFLSLSWVAVLAPFPTILFLMWNRNLQLSRNLREATEINIYLSKKISSGDEIVSPEEKEGPLIMLVFSGGTKETLEVQASDFYYAEAEGNYVKVTFRSTKGEKLVQKMLRITMKQAEDAATACPFIVRCHRAFLVNTHLVMKVDGNSQGYRLRLEGCDEEVPVSRAYAKEVKTLIENKLKG